jgi:hypothetical protein
MKPLELLKATARQRLAAGQGKLDEGVGAVLVGAVAGWMLAAYPPARFS